MYTNPFLSTLYSNLEHDYKSSRNMYSYFDKMEPESEEDKVAVNLERCFLTMLPGDFYAKYWGEDAKKQAAEYLRERIGNTHNIHLLTRYELHLFRITDDYNVLTKGIEDGIEMLKQLMAIPDSESAHTFCDSFKFLYTLAKKVKKAGDYEEILKSALLSGTPTYQRTILSTVYFSDQNQNNLVNPDAKPKKPLHLGRLFSAEHLAKLALELSEDKDINDNRHLLEIAAFYAEKTPNKKLKNKANEKLGEYWINQIKPDDPNNIAIAHLNDQYLRHALNCFQKAKNTVELRKTEKLLEENKPKLRYPVFSHSIPMAERNMQFDQINKIVKHIVDGGTESIFAAILGLTQINIFGKSAEQLEEYAKSNKKSLWYPKECGETLADSFGNVKGVSFEQFYIHQIVSNVYQNFTYHIFSLSIMKGLKQRTLTYEILSDYLLKLGFAHKIEKTFNGNTYGSTYLERVNIGLKEFLHQNELLMNNQPTDWRFCTTFLTTQFEGLLRDIILRLGGITTKSKRGTDTELILLEGLLNDECLKQVFDGNDLLLFRQTFTNAGYNIRNNIAHGMYLPQEFTSTKALLVFVSVLRVAKATVVMD